MKKILALLFLATTALADISTTNLLTFTNLNGTANGNSYVLPGRIAVYPQSYLIMNGGLTQTNAHRVNVQISFDNSTFQTVAVHYPATTASVTENYTTNFSSIPIYVRLQVVTTNAVNTSITAVTAPN